MPEPRPRDEINILSKKHGGRSSVKTYCKHFYQRPKSLTLTLCAGYETEDGIVVYPPCPDILMCLRNKAKAGTPKAAVKPSKRPKNSWEGLSEAVGA